MSRFYGCDGTAYDTLNERWWPRLVRFFRGLGFGVEEAEDLAQDTLVKLYLTKETLSFDLGQPLEPFLYTVARNQARGEWRRRKPETVSLLCIEEIDVKEPSSLPAAMIEDLFACIGNLPETEQTYLFLCQKHGLGELTHGEIAQILGKLPAQVTRISQRARARLGECLTAKGYASSPASNTAQEPHRERAIRA
jgi:RNA polymerase sigma factor (sigma-70 family)